MLECVYDLYAEAIKSMSEEEAKAHVAKKMCDLYPTTGLKEKDYIDMINKLFY